jgi:hypothetical protein
LKAIPTADLHDDAWIHLAIDKQPLSEPATKIVRADIPKIAIASVCGRVFGGALDDGSHATFGEFNERVARGEVLSSRIPMDVALDTGRGVGVTWFPAGAGRILPAWDSESVVLTVRRAFHMVRTDLWDFERAQADAAPELRNEIVAVRPSSPTMTAISTVVIKSVTMNKSGTIPR